MSEQLKFCPAPWRSLYIHPDGGVYPCHRYKNAIGSILKNSLEELWSSKDLLLIRKNLKRDAVDPGCEHCIKMENTGVPCLKNGYIEKSKNWPLVYEDVAKIDTEIKVLDISFSAKCNFSCRICGAHQSSSWNDEQVIEDEKQAVQVFERVKSVLPKLEEIIIAGGEPIISEGHLQLIKFLNDKNLYNIKLFYNTNFSHLSYKGVNFLEIWNKFSDVTLSISIDGSHKQGELLRKGFVWEKFIENYKKLTTEAPNVKVIFYCTVSILNASHLTTLFDNLLQLESVGPRQIYLNFLEYPNFYNIQVLDKSMKAKFSANIKQYIKMRLYSNYDFDEASILASRLMALIKYIFESDLSHLIPLFIEETDKLDEQRLENFNKIFPNWLVD